MQRCKMRSDGQASSSAERDMGVIADNKQGVSRDAAVEKAKLAWKHINKHLLCKPWKALTQP